MNDPEAIATPQPIAASHAAAAAAPILLETEPDRQPAPTWSVVLVGILAVLVTAEAVIAWAVL